MVTGWTLVTDGSKLDTGQCLSGWSLVSDGMAGHWSVGVTDWTMVSYDHRLDIGQ